MTWKLIVKDKAKQPSGNDYTLWKEQIAEECYNQCVYCAIHEAPWGGIDHYHIDHYRPKSIEEFKKLELDICNLFYACPICNRFKSNDWPGEPIEDLSSASYPDPSKVDYSTIFITENSTYKLAGKNIAANYITERLFLNRPQLIYERRESYLRQEEKQLRKTVLNLSDQLDEIEVTKKVLSTINNLIELLQDRNTIRPYKLSDIRKKTV